MRQRLRIVSGRSAAPRKVPRISVCSLLEVYVVAMRALGIGLLAFLNSVAFGQASKTTSFDVSSVKPSERLVGPDYNNQLTFSEVGLRARNVTLRRLVAEAYHLQLRQVIGQSWLDKNEFDIEAQAAHAIPKEELMPMLRSLLAEPG
jgi:hypothetical protein